MEEVDPVAEDRLAEDHLVEDHLVEDHLVEDHLVEDHPAEDHLVADRLVADRLVADRLVAEDRDGPFIPNPCSDGSQATGQATLLLLDTTVGSRGIGLYLPYRPVDRRNTLLRGLGLTGSVTAI
ncbi:hypothetical protein [Alicyclobacillus sp. ALC3]|uniref:hypothetical protein n=1 Tax=Alicyclobacillus sp. ALC3 TaxID=2796143 RepID=UPI002377E976|nr:hypothetical protein [Alicyclobacillus sp. ALC3]